MNIYTIKEIAKINKLSTRTVAREIVAGRLVASRLGKQWRIEESNYRKWINQGKNVVSDDTDLVRTPESSEVNKITISQPDLNASQTDENTPVTNQKESKELDIGEEVVDIQIVENAEKVVKYWNLYFPAKQPLTQDGHLPKTIKRIVERCLSENNNGLKYFLLTIRIVSYLYNHHLISGSKAALTIKQYFNREFHIIFAFPKLMPEQEEELENELASHDIFCYECETTTHTLGPSEVRKCPNCNKDTIEIRTPAINDDDVPYSTVLNLFYNQYRKYMERSQKQVLAAKLKAQKEFFEETYKRKYKSENEKSNPYTLDWLIIEDFNELKKIIYDPEYAKKTGNELPFDVNANIDESIN